MNNSITRSAIDARLTAGRAIAGTWLTTCIGVPLAVMVGAEAANNLALPHGPCGNYDGVFGAYVALYFGIPAAVVLTVYLFLVYSAGLKSRWWPLVPLGLYATVATVLITAGSDWCT